MTQHASRQERRQGRKKWVRPLLVIVVLVILSAAVGAAIFVSNYTPQVLLIDVLTAEIGGPLPEAQDFLAEDKDVVLSYSEDISALKDQLGEHKVTVQWGNRSQEVTIRVVDTVAPTGTIRDLTVLQKDMPTVEDFVSDIQDVTNVTVAFETVPDENDPLPQTVTVLLTDEGGNVTRLQATLTVIIDTLAPEITGPQDVVVYQGNTVAYRSGVAVTDDQDPAPVLKIDSSQVNLSAPGEYPVTYTATDFSGNVATVTVTVTVLEKKEDYEELEVIYAAVDKLLDKIITPDMDTYQQVCAIYKWVRGHCYYSNTTFKDDWRQAGYRMLQRRVGDCYYYFGLCKLMMERLGIPNIDVEKVPNFEGDSMHYWHLVSVDGGQTYYHVDTTPRRVPSNFCLVTDKVMDDFSAGYRNCFNRDKSLYPPTPENTPW